MRLARKPGERTHAEASSPASTVTAGDYGPAVAAYEAGRDPLAEPSDAPVLRGPPGAPDRLFAAVSPELGDGLSAAWATLVERSGLAAPEVLHLHHLTPLQEALTGRFPDIPLVTHLHGTELKMIDRTERLARLAENSEPTSKAWPTASSRTGARARRAAGGARAAAETRWDSGATEITG